MAATIRLGSKAKFSNVHHKLSQSQVGFRLSIAFGLHKLESTKMALIVWSNDLNVGNEFIDNDHKKLVKLVNDFHSAMEDGRGNEVVGKVLHNLVIYTKEHFAREEAEMQRIKYPRYLAHKLEHDNLLKEVAALQDGFNNGKAMLTIKVSGFLRDWLSTHIKQTDQLLAKALQ